MKILIDILHPAHVHFFRNFIKEMKKKNHKIIVTARKKDVALDLLKDYGLDFVCISKLKKGGLGLIKEFVTRTYRLYKMAKEFKPDVLLGVMGPSISVVGKLLKIPCIIFYNNENAKLTNFFAYPLATAVCTSSSYSSKVKGRHITYPGYHELAYLHPQRYKPKKKTLKELGVREKEKYILVRFVSWQASHDVGEKGLIDKKEVIEKLNKYGRVYITSESGLSKELKKYVLKIKNKKNLLDVINFATLIFGEGASIASEAAMLGVPAVFVNSLQLGYLKEQERDYGLVYNFKKQKPGLKKAVELLKTKNLKKKFQEKRKKMLKEKIDVTEWMIDFVGNRKWAVKSLKKSIT